MKMAYYVSFPDVEGIFKIDGLCSDVWWWTLAALKSDTQGGEDGVKQ